VEVEEIENKGIEVKKVEKKKPEANRLVLQISNPMNDLKLR